MTGPNPAVLRIDNAGAPGADIRRARLLEDVATVALHAARQRSQILPGMELRLTAHLDRRGDLVGQIGLRRQLCRDACGLSGINLPLDVPYRVPRVRVDVVRRLLEITLDAVLAHDLGDLLNGLLIGARVPTRGLDSKRLGEIGVDETVS